MASTYVNDLRLNELATGDGAGTWGTTTNTNLELIGEAFSYGTEAITTNADTHATTIADGATDPGRSMYLKYTGTLDSACTITIGPNTVSKMWFIENATTGSQNIIISQGSGANITIPAGDTKAVYSDGAGSGAAFVDAFASLSVVDLKVQDDLTVTDDMTVGGTLGVTGVLTATSLDISGDIDVDGTTNLDVVDIDGAVDMASTLAVGGVVTVIDGSTSAPSVTNAGDTNTGIYFPADDNFGIVVGGSRKLLANSSGVSINNGVLDADGGITVDNITIDGNEIDLSSGDLTIDVAGDIILDADGDDFIFAAAGTNIGKITNSSSDFLIRSLVQDKDIIFKGADGGSTITALTLDMSAAGKATFNSDITAVNALFKEGNSGAAATSGSANNLVLENSSNAGLTIATPADGIASIFYSDPDSNAAGYVQYNHSTNLHTIFSTGDIALDAGNDTISLKDSGTQFGEFISSSTDFVIKSSVSDKNLIFKGNDGGSAITALTLDMSAAGKAAFNAGATFNSNVAITTADNSDTLTLVSTDADANAGPILVFDRTSGSPADNDLIGQIVFQARNDAGQDTDYAAVKSYILDASDGTEDGQYNIETMVAGSLQTRLLVASSEIVLNESSIDTDFRVESNGKTHMLFVDGGNNRVGIMNSAPATSLHIGDSSGSQQIRLESNGGGASIKGTDTVNNASSGYTVGHLNGTNRYELTLGTIPIFDMYKTEVIFNEGSVDMDFRVESNNNANMLFVDGGNDRIGIGHSAPATILDIHGTSPTLNIRDLTSAATGVGGAITLQGYTSGTGSPNNFGKISGTKASGNVGGELTFSTSATNGTMTDRMIIDESGNVGIGTTSPTFGSGSGLEIEKSGTATLRLQDTSSKSVEMRMASNLEIVCMNSSSNIILNPTANTLFKVNGAEKGRFTTNGLTFNGDTAAANALDDYEEGTWTGTLTGSTSAPSTAITATGTYTKIGRSVTAVILFSNRNSTGVSGNIIVTGLPFTATAGGLGVGWHSRSNTGTGTNNGVMSYIGSNNDLLIVNGLGQTVTWASSGTGTYAQYTITYQV